MEITIHTENMIIKAQRIDSLTLFHRETKEEDGETGFWILKKPKYKKGSTYDLVLKYKDLDGKSQHYGASNKDHASLNAQFKSIQDQIKVQDKTWVDREFEKEVLR